MAPAGRREGCCSTDDGGCDHTLNDQVAALQAHVDQLKKEKDRLMDDKEEAMELVEWAERKLQEATERIEQLEVQLSVLQAGRKQAVQAPPGLDERSSSGPWGP